MSTKALQSAINTIDDDQMNDDFACSFKLMLDNPNFKDIHVDIAVKLEKYTKSKTPSTTGEFIINPMVGDMYITNNGSIVMLHQSSKDDNIIRFILIKGGYKVTKSTNHPMVELYMGPSKRGVVGEYIDTDFKGKFLDDKVTVKHEMDIKAKCDIHVENTKVTFKTIS